MRDSEGETEEYAYDSGPAVDLNISHYPMKPKSAIIAIQFVRGIALRSIAAIICDASVLAVPSSKLLDRDGRAGGLPLSINTYDPLLAPFPLT